ncbi:Bug family tripartite tricarboxylate transporter substrate binding protein [Limnohabitans sp. DCL3]|uniref:Bug family tripartite tricarboxylate transporter substrate binding protein n=1 Tax=Limnohabitans sp. DCL3 TaxID=3374103 RepID=UPI003A854A87
MNKRKLMAAWALCCLAMGAYAQGAAYPNKPIRLVVGFAPGGAADYVARAISDAMGKSLGQTVLVENRAGAGSSIAAENVAKAAPDGYSVLLASPSSISVNPALNPKLNYTPKDLVPVTKVTTSPLVIAVNPSIGIQSVQDLIARAKQAPGKINYATSGNGSAPHLGAALFTQLTGVDMVHIPFRGGAPAVQSVIAGDTQVTFGTPPSVLPMIQAGRLKGLAVSTKNSTPLVPGLPGMQEARLPEYAIEFWYGLFVPVGTPPAVMKKIFEATQTALAQPSVKAALAREGTDVDVSTSPESFGAFLNEDAKFWVNLVKSAGVKLD